MEAEEQEMGARWQGMGGWRHLVRTRLERSLPAAGLGHQQDVWQHQAWQGGSHAHGHLVGSVVHIHWGPSTGHLGIQGEGLGPLLSLMLLWHLHTELHPRAPQLPCALLGPNPPAQGVSLPSCPSLPPGHREPGTWTKLLSNMGSGRRGKYSPFWRVFCSSPRVGTHFRGPWSGSQRLMFQSRFIMAAESVGHQGHGGRVPAPQPTGPRPSDFSGSRGWSFPRAWTWPCRGAQPWPGGGAFVEELCDLIGHSCSSSWEVSRGLQLPSPPGTCPAVLRAGVGESEAPAPDPN